MGATTPYGVLGLATDWAAKRWLVVNVGFGAGGGGPQMGITPRLRMPVGDGIGVGVEAGLSAGRYAIAIPFLRGAEWDRPHTAVVWTNTGAVLDGRAGGGYHFRVFGGVEWMTYCDDKKCNGYSAGERRLPYAGIAMGYAIPL